MGTARGRRRMNRLSIFGIAVVLGSVGCGNRTTRIIQCAVERDWGCASVTINPAFPGYHAVGCGRDEMYVCKIAADGCQSNDGRHLNTYVCMDTR